MFPSEGYKILDPPANYAPIRTPLRRLNQTPTPLVQTGFRIQVISHNLATNVLEFTEFVIN